MRTDITIKPDSQFRERFVATADKPEPRLSVPHARRDSHVTTAVKPAAGSYPIRKMMIASDPPRQGCEGMGENVVEPR